LKFWNNLQSRKRICPCASLSECGEYDAHRPPTPLLDTINYPIHMKNLSVKVRPRILQQSLLYLKKDESRVAHEIVDYHTDFSSLPGTETTL